jgi:predicted metal-dependent hydrolase
MNEVLMVENLEFEVRRSPRRKTMGLTVDHAGELIVHSPIATGKTELAKWVESKLLWVHQKLLQKDNYPSGTKSHEPVSGECIAYLGQNYRLNIVKKQSVPLRFEGQWFTLREKDRLEAAKHFQSWYQEKGGEWIGERVKFWEPKVGIATAKIVVTNLGFRWGSCGKNKALFFNWRLLQLPVRLVDYVIVHELVHLIERNHTKEYWRTLERILPDWRERKEELSRNRAEMRWSAAEVSENQASDSKT